MTSPRTPRRRGMTLVELVVVLPIFLIVSYGVFEVLSGGFRLYSLQEGRLDNQASALVTLNTLAYELRNTSPSSLTFTSAAQGVPVACSFRRYATSPIRGSMGSNPFVVYWHDPTRQAIARAELSYDPSYQRLDANTLGTTLAAQASPHYVAWGIRSFNLATTSADQPTLSSSTFPDATITNPVFTVQLTVSNPGASGTMPAQEMYSTSVAMRVNP